MATETLTIDKTIIGRTGNGVVPGILLGSALGIGGLSSPVWRVSFWAVLEPQLGLLNGSSVGEGVSVSRADSLC